MPSRGALLLKSTTVKRLMTFFLHERALNKLSSGPAPTTKSPAIICFARLIARTGGDLLFLAMEVSVTG